MVEWRHGARKRQSLMEKAVPGGREVVESNQWEPCLGRAKPFVANEPRGGVPVSPTDLATLQPRAGEWCPLVLAVSRAPAPASHPCLPRVPGRPLSRLPRACGPSSSSRDPTVVVEEPREALSRARLRLTSSREQRGRGGGAGSHGGGDEDRAEQTCSLQNQEVAHFCCLSCSVQRPQQTNSTEHPACARLSQRPQVEGGANTCLNAQGEEAFFGRNRGLFKVLYRSLPHPAPFLVTDWGGGGSPDHLYGLLDAHPRLGQ
ncbi:uncharacterized protein LOC131500097 [Neofelis nebulosa]|uniref:uncharacterized protein LOC131500097 n=1 Tax=Neofelis nebulosa TaxID=61452 RepID=UPI002729FF6A|nr:uncharacterized protein LOC131500097 [Neofelis nebulosa]